MNYKIYLIALVVILNNSISLGQVCGTCPNQTNYGIGSWIGYVYDHNGAGNPVTNPFATYKGCVTETAIFNRDWGTGNPSCAAGGNNFAVRYRMRMNFAPGTYSITIGGDDGVRLSFDGGATFAISDWADHAYRTTTQCVYLSGSHDLVLEFYEKGGNARVSFNYTFVSAGAFGPTDWGVNQWLVSAFNGTNMNPLANSYQGYYIQPALGANNAGINTTLFWGTNNSPMNAGVPVDNGNLWNGCTVANDNHMLTYKRRGFPCGLYTFDMLSWDDQIEIYINGVLVWSCATWSGGGVCPTGVIGNFSLDHTSEVEVRHVEFTGGSNVNLRIEKAIPTQLSVNGSTRTCDVTGGTDFIHFVDNNGRLIASVNPENNNLGNVTMTSYVQLAPFEIDACDDPKPQFNTAVLGRRWVITPQNQPTSNVRVRLYYSANEYSALQPVANNNANPNDNTVGIADLHLSKYHNTTNPALVNNIATDNCVSGVTTIFSPNTSGTLAPLFAGFAGTGRYNEYTIDSFSEFWLHGSDIMSPLPVTLTSFAATCQDDGVLIAWSTASEQNAAYFDVERSRDGFIWEKLGTLSAAGTTNINQHYAFTDYSNQGGIVYYRLRQVDMDGVEELYGPISSNCEQKSNALTVFPNPTSNSFTVQVYTTESHDNSQLAIFDYTGKLILSKHVDLSNGVQTHNFSDSGLAKEVILFICLLKNNVSPRLN